jgi:L-threonylcarbamoyladenylate synthase
MMTGTGTEILPTSTRAQFDAAVRRAAELLRSGEVVALPTETVYGLAANAFNAVAVAKIFEAKGRPAHNPVICHVAGKELIQHCVARWPAVAEKLADAFWPGPLTLVVPRSSAIPDIVTAGGDTVGIRWPAHPFMQAVIAACDFPLAAPSANLSNQLSPTSAEHVHRQLAGRIPLIVDGGAAQVGIESTVVDASSTPPRLLRPGMIHEEALLAVTGELATGETSGVLRSPGLLKKHYSPRAPLRLLEWRDANELRAKLAQFKADPRRTCVLTQRASGVGGGFLRVAVLPHDADAFARALYAELHQADAAGAEWIIVETPPAAPAWRAISDRLTRAAAE